MDTSSSFWEVFEALIVFVLINARSKLNYCAMSHITHWGELLLPVCSPFYARELRFIYYRYRLIKCVCILILSDLIFSGWEMKTSFHDRLAGKYECRQWKFCRDNIFDFVLDCVYSCIRPCSIMICLCVCQCLWCADSMGMCCLLWDTGIALSCQHSFWTGRKAERVLSCLVKLKNDSHFWLIMCLQNLYKSLGFHLSVESSSSALCETEFHAVDLSWYTHKDDFQTLLKYVYMHTSNNVILTDSPFPIPLRLKVYSANFPASPLEELCMIHNSKEVCVHVSSIM